MKNSIQFANDDAVGAPAAPEAGRENGTAPLLCLLFLLYFMLNLRQLMDYDVWYQLIAGSYTIEHMAIPRTEFYIYSGLGESAVFTSWLWGTVLYLCWLISGYTGISVFNATVWGLVFLIGAKAAVEIPRHDAPLSERASPRLHIIAAFVASSVAYQYLAVRANARAEVTLFLVWVVAVYFSAGIANDRGRLHRFLVTAPLLAWMLGWIHTTAVFITAFLVFGLVQASMDSLRARGAGEFRVFVREDLWKWILSIFFSASLPLLNPNGIHSALALFTSSADVILGIFDVKSTAPKVLHVNLEYRGLLDVPERWPLASLFFVSALFVIWQDKRRRIANLLLMLLGLSLSLLHVRGLAVWAIFLMIPLAICLAKIFAEYESRIGPGRRRSLANCILLACCFWSAGVVFNTQRAFWGAGYAHSPATESVLKTIKQDMPRGGNIFNWHADGAFLRWHLGDKYLVAMDGHLLDEKSPMSAAYHAIEDFNERTPALIEQWAIGAVYHHAVNPITGEIYSLPYYLLNNRDWRVGGVSEGNVLFTKKADPGDERNRNLLNAEYWRTVAANARNIELRSSQPEYKIKARASFELAVLNLETIQKTLNGK